jgi:hypothetical protein
MTHQLRDRWFDRDLLVLTAAARLLEDPDGRGIPPDENALARVAGLEVEQVLLALTALSPAYLSINVRNAAGTHVWVQGMTTAARQAVGLWPTADSLAQHLLDTLDRMVRQASGEDQSRLEQLRAHLTSVGGEAFAAFVGTALAGLLPR